MEVLNNICLNITDCEHKTAPIQEKGISSIRTTDIKNGVIDFKGSNKGNVSITAGKSGGCQKSKNLV